LLVAAFKILDSYLCHFWPSLDFFASAIALLLLPWYWFCFNIYIFKIAFLMLFYFLIGCFEFTFALPWFDESLISLYSSL